MCSRLTLVAGLWAAFGAGVVRAGTLSAQPAAASMRLQLHASLFYNSEKQDMLLGVSERGRPETAK